MSEERIIHNGEIIDPVPGVQTEPPPERSNELALGRTPGVEDVEPEVLAALMAKTISEALSEVPVPVPMEIVNRLLRLKTERGHKVVWTRFDVNQVFAIWTSKLDKQRTSR